MAPMRLVAIALLVLLLAVPASAASVTATLTTSTRAPTVGEPWRYTVTVRSGGRPIAARMRLQTLVGQTVVGCWKNGALARCRGGSPGDWIAFRGKRTGVIRWRADSVGVRLTFRALVNAGGKTLRLRAPVTVRRSG
jgi:hypothetical protein